MKRKVGGEGGSETFRTIFVTSSGAITNISVVSSVLPVPEKQKQKNSLYYLKTSSVVIYFKGNVKVYTKDCKQQTKELSIVLKVLQTRFLLQCKLPEDARNPGEERGGRRNVLNKQLNKPVRIFSYVNIIEG